MNRYDVTVIGGGVLGTSVAYWLGARFDGSVAVIEREQQVAAHASGRNTGVIHRPFYLHPQERRLFARAAALSFPMWREYAARRLLPWAEVGTLKVAMTENQVKSLERNLDYALANGMDPTELELMDSRAVSKIEPEVRCAGGLLIKTDTVVDFKAMTMALREDAEALGVRFLTGHAVEGVDTGNDGLTLHTSGQPKDVSSSFTVNCGGGGALDLAHMFGVAGEYADMHFRGEYWRIDEAVAGLVNRNVYCVPHQEEFPFLDPHWIIRADGRREIGPNAAPVPGPTAYEGLFRHVPDWIGEMFRPPTGNKIRIWLNADFTSLSVREMWSSLSKSEMLRRVAQFVPRLRLEHIGQRGTAGVRSVVIDSHGRLLKEAIEVPGPHSLNILNFNSPGATGAPAYAAHIVRKLGDGGFLDHMKQRPESEGFWSWEKAS